MENKKNKSDEKDFYQDSNIKRDVINPNENNSITDNNEQEKLTFYDEKNFYDSLKLSCVKDDDFRIQFGSRIRKYRKGLNFTQEKFSEFIGVSGNYLGEVERGNATLSFESVINLSKKTGISIDYLVFGKKQKFSPDISSLVSNRLHPLYSLLDYCTCDQLDVLESMIKSFKL